MSAVEEKFFSAKPRQNFEYLSAGRYDRLTLAGFKWLEKGGKFAFELVPRVAGQDLPVPEGRTKQPISPVDRPVSLLMTLEFDDNDILSLFHALAKRPVNQPLTIDERLTMFDKLGLPYEELAKFYGSTGKDDLRAECYKKLAEPGGTAKRPCHFRGVQVAGKSWWKVNQGKGKPENKGKAYMHWDFSAVAQTPEDIANERKFLESIGA